MLDTVELDGTSSSDANGDALGYLWSVVAAPEGSVAELALPTQPIAQFIPDLPGIYQLQLVVNDGYLQSLPAVTEITALSLEAVIVDLIQESIGIIEGEIEITDLKNRNNKGPLAAKLNAVIDLVDAGLYAEAIDKLENDVIGKTDGCAFTGSPDRNDWITNCDAQSLIYPLLMQALEKLKLL